MQSEYSLITNPASAAVPKHAPTSGRFQRGAHHRLWLGRNVSQGLKTPALGLRRRAWNPTVPITVLKDLRCIAASAHIYPLSAKREQSPCAGLTREVSTYKGDQAARKMRHRTSHPSETHRFKGNSSGKKGGKNQMEMSTRIQA